MTDAYLAPIKLRTTTLTLIYPTLSLPSWSAGSREVACSIGATLGNGGWAALVNGAKGPLLINGQPPVPPPDIPEERLTMPPIPVQVPAQRRPASPAPRRTHAAGQSAPAPATAGWYATPRRHRRLPPSRRRRRRPRRPRPTAPGRRRRRDHRWRRTAAPAEPAPGGASPGGRADGPAAVRRVGLRRTRPDPARAGGRNGQRRRPGRRPPSRGRRTARALRRGGADRAGFRLRRIVADTITIYRDALLDVCESDDEVVEEVAITVIHEIAHHFGIDDDRLEELGWA